jgi:serine protease Do
MADTATKSSKSVSKTAKNIFNSTTLIIIIVALVAGGIGGFIGAKYYSPRLTSLDSTAVQQKIVSSQSDLIASIAKEVSPSVVSITVKSQSQASTLQQLFGGQGAGTSESAGTGIIISSDGMVVTNKHVIPDGTTSVSITTSDGTKYDDVKVVARDPRSNVDVAFVKINGAKNLKPAKIGDSSKMQVGDAVVAIGYALGEFENTVTSGIISGLGRPITAGDGSTSTETLSNLFQTDAAINPGNSGGPLVNMNSEVIGINTAVAGNAQNIGFSIPVNDVKSQISSILEKGKLEVPYMGVRYVVLTPAIKQQFDLSTDTGAWLKATNATQAVINGSPADKAGLKEGDIITKVNGEAIDADNPLAQRLSKYKVGDTLEITYVRDGKTSTTKVTLETAPNTNN